MASAQGDHRHGKEDAGGGRSSPRACATSHLRQQVRVGAGWCFASKRESGQGMVTLAGGTVLEVITSRTRYISSQAAGKGQGSALGMKTGL